MGLVEKRVGWSGFILIFLDGVVLVRAVWLEGWSSSIFYLVGGIE